MADSQLIINANTNAQRAVETSNKAFDCVKELAVVQGQHVLTISALARALFEAEVQIVEMRELLGLPLDPHMQEVKSVSATLRAESEAAIHAVQAEMAAYEGKDKAEGWIHGEPFKGAPGVIYPEVPALPEGAEVVYELGISEAKPQQLRLLTDGE